MVGNWFFKEKIFHYVDLQYFMRLCAHEVR